MMHSTKTKSILTVVSILFLLTVLAACGSKDEAVQDPTAHEQSAESPPKEEISNIENGVPSERAEAEIEKQIEEAAETPSPYVELKDIVPSGPLAAVRLRDGTQYEIIQFEKLGKYYLYITGKLNGRSSTVICLTRFQDLQKWDSITFQDQYNFTIATRNEKSLRFLNSRMYMGSSSHDTFTFYVPNGMDNQRIEVKKRDVEAIMIAPPPKDDD